jgi:hypothetical protein
MRDMIKSISYLLDYAKIDPITVENMIESTMWKLMCMTYNIDDDCFKITVLPIYNHEMLSNDDLKQIDNIVKNYLYE